MKTQRKVKGSSTTPWKEGSQGTGSLHSHPFVLGVGLELPSPAQAPLAQVCKDPTDHQLILQDIKWDELSLLEKRQR